MVCANRKQEEGTYALHNAFIQKGVKIGNGAYVENAYLDKGVVVEDKAVVSGLQVPENCILRKNAVYHGLKLQNGKFAVRVYGVDDNPKGTLEKDDRFIHTTLQKFMDSYGLAVEDIWSDSDHSLWKANIYPECDTIKECMDYAELLIQMTMMSTTPVNAGDADETRKTALCQELLEQWKKARKTSLYSSFNQADGSAIIPWRENLEDQIRVSKFVQAMMSKVPVQEALEVFGGNMRKTEQKLLLERIDKASFSEKLRIYYGMAQAAKKMQGEFEETDEENFMQACFAQIQNEISTLVEKKLEGGSKHKIQKPEVNISLPVRVNWGGGWTDTPPHCNEHGGVVLNAAISLKGNLPVQVSVRKLEKLVVELESQDIGAHGVFTQMDEVNDCGNPYDKFALHKAALIACGVIRKNKYENQKYYTLRRIVVNWFECFGTENHRCCYRCYNQ